MDIAAWLVTKTCIPGGTLAKPAQRLGDERGKGRTKKWSALVFMSGDLIPQNCCQLPNSCVLVKPVLGMILGSKKGRLASVF